MKKVYRMEGVDCAGCAAEMSENIRKIPGVADANVNVLMQKLSIELEDGCSLDEILPMAVRACKRVDPGCEILL